MKEISWKVISDEPIPAIGSWQECGLQIASAAMYQDGKCLISARGRDRYGGIYRISIEVDETQQDGMAQAEFAAMNAIEEYVKKKYANGQSVPCPGGENDDTTI